MNKCLFSHKKVVDLKLILHETVYLVLKTDYARSNINKNLTLTETKNANFHPHLAQCTMDTLSSTQLAL